MDAPVAPSAFNIPIILVRSKIMINNPDIMVNPEMPIISIRITQTFIFNNPSQANSPGLRSSIF